MKRGSEILGRGSLAQGALWPATHTPAAGSVGRMGSCKSAVALGGNPTLVTAGASGEDGGNP